MAGTCRCRRGFTWPELAAAVVVVALLTAMLVGLAETRRQGRLGEDIGKLRQIGAWTAAYAADNSDQFWSFSWQKNKVYASTSTSIPTWPAGSSDVQAQANQAVDILHRIAGREDIVPIPNWFANIAYSHLVLVDYLKSEIPNLAFVSSADRHRLRWARDPHGFDAGLYQPAPSGTSGPGTNAGKRWPYGASVQLSTSFYDQSNLGLRVYQGPSHTNYFTPIGSLAGRLTAGVAFPSQKVHIHDATAWHFGPRVSHFAFPEMRLPLLFTDGSVQVRASADANLGWAPNLPTSVLPTALSYTYSPDSWEPPTLTGASAQLVNAGLYRWTRAFLDGRDFGGPEACTGQLGCP